MAATPDGRRAIFSCGRTVRGCDSITLAHLAGFHADAHVYALATGREGVLVAGDESGAVHILQCLSSISKVEADRDLDGIEQRIRSQISHFGRYAIGDHASGAVAQVDQALSNDLFFMITLEIRDDDKVLGEAVFTGRTDPSICGSSFKIMAANFRWSDQDIGWYGNTAQAKYQFHSDDGFYISLGGANEQDDPDGPPTERYISAE